MRDEPLPRPEWRAMNVIYRHQIASPHGETGPTARQLLTNDVDPDALVRLVNLGFAAAYNPFLEEPVGVERLVTRGSAPRAGDRHDPAVCCIGITPAGASWMVENWWQVSLLAVHEGGGRATVDQLIHRDGAFIDALVGLYESGLVVALDPETGQERPLTRPDTQFGRRTNQGWSGGDAYRLRVTNLGRHILGAD